MRSLRVVLGREEAREERDFLVDVCDVVCEDDDMEGVESREESSCDGERGDVVVVVLVVEANEKVDMRSP